MKARGFTLIELIIVVVLLGIASVTITFFFTGTVRGYLDTASRQDSAALARIALDRIARELREASPQSVRVSADRSCLQFFPIAASTVYTSLAANSTAVSVVDFTVPPATPLYAAVYPINADELYSGTALKGVTIGGASSNIRALALASAFTLPTPRTSPGERLFIVSNPVSFCFNGGQLNRYANNAITVAQPSPTSGLANGAMLADKLNVAQSFFRYELGNWQQNGLVTINITVLQSNGEQLQLDHEVWLRNVQ